jgi:hypothetical protein
LVKRQSAKWQFAKNVDGHNVFFKYKDICWWSKKPKTSSHIYNVTKTSLIKNKYFHWRIKMSSVMFICFCLRSNLLMNWMLEHYRCQDSLPNDNKPNTGNTKGGSITVPLTSCLTGLELAVWQLTIFVSICKTD